jgi:hypothetical protein
MTNPKYSFLFLFFLIAVACDDDPSPSVPSCVDLSELNDFATIRVQTVDDTDHYWINTGANEADGDEFIVSSSCDTLCFYGGWVDPECVEDYDINAWEVVWP